MVKGRGAWLVLALSLVFLPCALAQQKGASTERSLFDAVNRERRQQGLPALKWDDALAGAAHKHAVQMAEQNSLSHQFAGEASLPARVAQARVRATFTSNS